MKIPILKTKLHCPSLQSKHVYRPLLIQRLNEGLDSGREITLVSAPAGYGKTACITEWIHSLDLPVAWLSLDPSDNDPVRFYNYLIAALKRIDLDLGQEVEAVIRTGQVPPSDIVSTLIINDILELKTKFLLVLDDLHTIQDNSILEVLKKFLDNHPWPLHLVLITREDPPLPLARLRANNKLNEIRAKELRFSGDDIKIFLDKVMGLSLSENDISILEEKTEGWIAGLQLAGLAIRNARNRSNFISNLSGSYQFILFYFTEQVLYQLSEDVRGFLFKTAILDQFNSDLCDAITGHPGAKEMLQRLYNANLFLVPLDDEQQWYRYHHFFADLLRDIQKQSEVDNLFDLHKRASQWYAEAGMPEEAIHHALAAEDYSMAIELLENHASMILMQGYAITVENWIQAIPDKWRLKCPKTNLAFAWVHLLRGTYSGLSQLINRVEPTTSGVKNSNITAEWLVMKSLVLYMQGEIEACMDIVKKALEIMPYQDNRILGLAYYVHAHVYMIRRNYAKANSLFRKSIQHSQEAKSLVPEMMSTISLVSATFEQGKLHQAYQIVTRVVNRLESSNELPPISAFIYLALGDIYYQWNQIEEAHQATNRAFQLSTLGGLNTGLISCRINFSKLFQITQDFNAAEKEVQNAFDLLPLEAPEYIRQYAVAQRVRVFLDLNQLDSAESALQGHGINFNDLHTSQDLFPDQFNPSSLGMLYNSFLLTLLYQEHDEINLQNGLELASRIVIEAERRNQFLISLEALLLRAQLHVKLGNLQACNADIVQALKRGQPEGIVGIFVEQRRSLEQILQNLLKTHEFKMIIKEYIEMILASFAQPKKTDLELVPLLDPLTDREQDVLRLMAEGLKYKEIAAKLFVSLNTIRYHIKAIYGKLEVNNRTQALEKARKYQLL